MSHNENEFEETATGTGKALIQDIFGSDDEDDDNNYNNYYNSSNNSNNSSYHHATTPKTQDADDGWDDSDDDNDNNNSNIGSSKSSKGSRLQKSNKSSSKHLVSKTMSKRPSTADIFGSDDDDEEEDEELRISEKKVIKKRKKHQEERKKRKKSKVFSEKTKQSSGEKEDSGDEYDSGEEMARTKDDDNFIDEEDEQDYLVKEYDEDNQDFRDDRPDSYRKPSKKSLSSSSKKLSSSDPSSARGSSGKSDTKVNDPLSETIASLKKHKEVLLSQPEKESFVKDLLHKMAIAAITDDELMSKGQPATCKLQMLEGVKKAVALNQLQETLVENDVLSRLKEWIEPKNDTERTLPSLTVRTAVYEMLHSLPCYAEHLKRSGIGVTIISLRKHKNETIPNKKLLRDLVEKWCRPLFGKSVDQSSRGDIEYNEELKLAASRQKLMSSIAEEKVAVDSILTGETFAQSNNAKARVRTPYNNGYVFTVRPENHSVEKRDLQREQLGESRMNIMKLIRVRKGGKKDNFRAIQVDASGRDKA